LKKAFQPGVVGTVVTLTQAISQFMVLATLSSFYGIETVGEFSYINSIVLVVYVALSFGLRNAYVLDSEKFGVKTFYIVRMIGLFSAFIICYLTVILTQPSLIIIFYPLVLYRVIELLFELQWAQQQIQANYYGILISQAGRYVISSICLIGLTILTGDIQLTLWGYALSGLVFLSIVNGKSIIDNIYNDSQKIQILACLRHCAPLSISLTAMSIQNNGVRFFLGLWAGNSVLGLFAIAYQIFTMPSMVFMAALNFYLKKSSKEKTLDQYLILKLCIPAVLMMLLAWYLLGNYFINLFFGAPFLVIFVPCIYLIASLIFKFLGYFYQWNLMNRGEYKMIAKHQVLVSILVTLSSAISVYYLDLVGGYIALVSSAFIYCFYFYFLNKKLVT
jgi:O-antigen/teichoic acid export membrane protein